MRALLLASCLLASAPLRGPEAAAASAEADWRRAELPEGAKEALAAAGYRFEDDGRVLDPETYAPLSADRLAAAVWRLGLSTQRLALERLSLILAKQELAPEDRAAIQALKGDLPQGVADAAGANVDLDSLRTLADQSLANIAGAFDGSRSLEERRAAARPLPSPEMPRRAFPYFNEEERTLGKTLGAALAGRISEDPFGAALLRRSAMPPVVVEDLKAGAAAYDYRRRVMVVDRSSLLASALEQLPPGERAELGRRLASRQALLEHLGRHPQAVAAFAAKNDVLVVHELVHARQDRRDDVLREMSRGNLPQLTLLEYEEEAWMTKNLYLHSKIKRRPKSVQDDAEFQDYLEMSADARGWIRSLRQRYIDFSPAAVDLDTARALLARRLEATRSRRTATPEEQTARSLDLTAQSRAARELESARGAARRARNELVPKIRKVGDERSRPLAILYLGWARRATNPVEFSARIAQAESFALAAGDQALAARIRGLKERGR